jgi:hypothetical protein
MEQVRALVQKYDTAASWSKEAEAITENADTQRPGDICSYNLYPRGPIRTASTDFGDRGLGSRTLRGQPASVGDSVTIPRRSWCPSFATGHKALPLRAYKR